VTIMNGVWEMRGYRICGLSECTVWNFPWGPDGNENKA